MLPLAWVVVPPAGDTKKSYPGSARQGPEQSNMSLNRPGFLGTLGTFSRQESEQLLP